MPRRKNSARKEIAGGHLSISLGLLTWGMPSLVNYVFFRKGVRGIGSEGEERYQYYTTWKFLVRNHCRTSIVNASIHCRPPILYPFSTSTSSSNKLPPAISLPPQHLLFLLTKDPNDCFQTTSPTPTANHFKTSLWNTQRPRRRHQHITTCK